MPTKPMLLLLALAAANAAAQGFYYQSTMPDGRVVIGDKPAPGAKETKQIPLRQGNISAPLAKPGAATTNPQKEAREEVDGELAEAQQQLQNAKNALESGRDPQPGERIGTAGGGTRLTEAYSKRIKTLEDGVTAAQQRVDQALARRGATR